MRPFHHKAVGKWKGRPVNQINHARSVAVVTQTDHPKSDCNRCVMNFVTASCIAVGIRVYVIESGHIFSFSLFKSQD